jgi:sulfite dehydrogenase
MYNLKSMITNAFSDRAVDRRRFLAMTAAGAGALVLGRRGWAADSPASATNADLGIRFPEKSGLILHTERPPNLETPLKYFSEDLTPNDAFFVRWHLAIIPTEVDTATFQLEVGGHVQKPMSLSLDELRKGFEPASVVAVCQCSGNSRRFFDPRVPGVQWGNGAMGNARWTGVRLKDLLAKAGAKAGAVDVSFNGLDGPVLPAAANFAGTPDFEKSLPFDRANDGEVIVAYEINGQPLPMLNGFPLRLIVPGWFATYWVKSLNQITVHQKPFDGFWMAKAYRVPATPDYKEEPKNQAKDTVPITTFTVRSLFVRPEPGEAIRAGAPYEVQGIAFDSGKGIAKVEVSADGGKSWSESKLDPEIGRYSFRRWRYAWKPTAGAYHLMARATSKSGETQTTSQWNRSGYGRNVVESVQGTVS